MHAVSSPFSVDKTLANSKNCAHAKAVSHVTNMHRIKNHKELNKLEHSLYFYMSNLITQKTIVLQVPHERS